MADIFDEIDIFDQVAEEQPKQASGSFLDTIAEMGRKGPLTVARESFSENPEPYLDSLPTIGTVVGGVMGGIPGAGLGGMAGEAYRQIGQRMTGTGTPPESSIEAIAQMGKTGGEGLVAETGGELALKALPYAAKVGKGAAKQYGKVAKLFSNVPKSDIVRLADDPAAILPEFLGGSKSTAKAGRELGDAVKEAGFLPEGKAIGAKRLEAFAGQETPFKESNSVASKYFERVARGEKLTPEETYDAYQAAQETISKTTRENSRYVEMLQFKDALQWELKNILDATGQYADATKDFARAALGRNTSNILPRTNTGQVSQGRIGFNSMITGSGLALGTPAGAAAFALSSPAFYGATTAATSAAAKGTARAIENPIARRVGFSEIVRRANKKEKKK